MPWTQLWCSQEKAGWGPGHKHNGLVEPLCRATWIFTGSSSTLFCNTDHLRAEVLVTFITVSNASQQLSRPEMLVATWWPQSEPWESVPNERVIGHQKSSVALMFPYPPSHFFLLTVIPALSWPVRLQLAARTPARTILLVADRPTLGEGSGPVALFL